MENKPLYTESETLKRLKKQLEEYEASKPKKAESTYTKQINDTLDKLSRRGSFAYDPSDDAMYDSYKKEYERQGRLAMRDTAAQAAALTGGYGSSYGETAAAQAYGSWLGKLDDLLPELYEAAYARYESEGNELLNLLDTLNEAREGEEAAYQADLDDYYNDLRYYYGKYDDLSEAEYARYKSDLASWQADRDYYYKLGKAASSSAKGSGGDTSKKKVKTVTVKEEKQNELADALANSEVRTIMQAVMGEPTYYRENGNARGALKSRLKSVLGEYSLAERVLSYYGL